MIDAFGARQRELMALLLNRSQGMTIEGFVLALGISKTAVRIHLQNLCELGYVAEGEKTATKGRPGQVYLLTNKGYDLFPKQYAWFSELLLKSIHQEKGSDGLKAWLETLGSSVGASFVEGLKDKSPLDRLAAITGLMNSLAYQAETREDDESEQRVGVEASNCVFHSLAKNYPEVCAFDIALLTKLSGMNVLHKTCMARGEASCRFAFTRVSF